MKCLLFAAVALTPAIASVLPAQTLQEFSGAKKATVTIFADGGVRSVVGQPAGATSSTGSLGVNFRGSSYVVSGVVNVLSRSDTISSGYGASLLPPASGRSFNSALLDVRRPILPGLDEKCTKEPKDRVCQFGLHMYASASASTWATAKDATGKPTAVTDVPVWGSGLGAYYTFFDGGVKDTTTRVAMALDATLASRHLRGDLSAADATNAALRKAILGTSGKDFNGLEIGLNIRYNELNAGLTYYSFGGDVAGLSHGQVVAAISVRATLNSGLFKDMRDE